MRTTQYIGLTQKAKAFVAMCSEKKSTNKTSGMFGEDVPLGKWCTKSGKSVKEVVQCTPWSSGPMIFTCLEIDNGKFFQWLNQPMKHEQEYDEKQGIIYL